MRRIFAGLFGEGNSDSEPESHAPLASRALPTGQVSAQDVRSASRDRSECPVCLEGGDSKSCLCDGSSDEGEGGGQHEARPQLSLLELIDSYDEKVHLSSPLHADIYQMVYLGVEGTYLPTDWHFDHLFTPILARLVIPAIQVISPLAIMAWAASSLDWPNFQLRLPFDPKKLAVTSPWATLSSASGHVLAFMFLFLFPMVGSVKCTSDDERLVKLRYLLFATKFEGRLSACWLTTVSPMINTWCVVLSCIDLWLVFLMDGSPKDIIFDSLGLLFLYSLDDVPGDLGLLSWPADSAGGVYWDIMYNKWITESFLASRPRHNYHWKEKGQVAANPDKVYEFTEEVVDGSAIRPSLILAVGKFISRLLAFVLPFAFIFAVGGLKKLKEA